MAMIFLAANDTKVILNKVLLLSRHCRESAPSWKNRVAIKDRQVGTKAIYSLPSPWHHIGA